jgi:hypothetical protein
MGRPAVKRDLPSDTDPIPGLDEVTHPVEPPGIADASQEVPNELDPKTARILKALDRPPRPPAPTPEVRASSGGGDFVAYSAAARPPGVAPRTDEERRRQALAELSALVQESPAVETPAHGSTSTVAPRLRPRRPRWGLWLVGVVVVATSVAVWGASKSGGTSPPLRVAASASASAPLTEKHMEPVLPPMRIASDPTVLLRNSEPAPETPVVPSEHHQQKPLRSPPRPSETSSRPPPVASSATSSPDELIEHPW